MSNEKQTALEAMLSQYDKATTSSQKKETTFDLKNYFSIYLPDGINSDTKKIRILPTESGTPFQELYLHTAEVDGQQRKFPCLKHHGDTECPFCEAREQLLSSGDKAEAELSKNYRTKKYWVVKVIDRQDESHGPKFWRFKNHWQKAGAYDKIMGIVKSLHEDIGDAKAGRDLVLNIEKVDNPRGGKPYPVVNSIIPLNNTPLSGDLDLSEKWVNDTKTWEDVYSTKGYDYLAIVVGGHTPVYSKKLEKFVKKEDLEDDTNLNAGLESEISLGATTAPMKELVEENVTVNSYVADIDKSTDNGDDLPF
tara:strand:+ start:11817 stop:12740 length:924 start_codon:yes stop_codon:yes gene_type:complete